MAGATADALAAGAGVTAGGAAVEQAATARESEASVNDGRIGGVMDMAKGSGTRSTVRGPGVGICMERQGFAPLPWRLRFRRRRFTASVSLGADGSGLPPIHRRECRAESSTRQAPRNHSELTGLCLAEESSFRGEIARESDSTGNRNTSDAGSGDE
ncbi:MAG: hypothetical protein AMXMBFR55_13870 [Gemmatimonadota bacterium]